MRNELTLSAPFLPSLQIHSTAFWKTYTVGWLSLLAQIEVLSRPAFRPYLNFSAKRKFIESPCSNLYGTSFSS